MWLNFSVSLLSSGCLHWYHITVAQNPAAPCLTCLMLCTHAWCGFSGIHKIVMRSSLIFLYQWYGFPEIYMSVFICFFFREGPVLSSCWLNVYIFIIAGNSSWFPGILRRARRANPSFANILSLENNLKKHVMFRLFYLKGYCFLRRALEPCTSIVTHAIQCNTDLYGTNSP